MLFGIVRSAVAAAVLLGPALLAGEEVALTFDDLPRHGALPPGGSHGEAIAAIARTLADRGAPPTYGFLNAGKLENDPALREALVAWREAGHPLGNHAYSHMNLHENSAEDFIEDAARNEPLLKELMAGEDWRWFRYPYLREGNTLEKRYSVQKMLRERGYRNAAVTLDFEDYAWNAPYARCAAKGDQDGIAWLERSYLETAEEYIDLGVETARLLYGREIKHTMLLHVGAFNARMVPKLLDLLEHKGLRLVPLQEAQADPAYESEPGVPTQAGITLLEHMMKAKGWTEPEHRPKPFEKLSALCR